MNYVIAICGFLGSWLLVAGPVYQAALELREQEVDREQIDAVVASVTAPPRLSSWWWLLPPAAYFLQRRRSMAHRTAVMAALGPEPLRQTVQFINKATGWLTVAVGALLLAVKETWELLELLEWPVAVFWVLVVVCALLCMLNAVLQMLRTNRVLAREEDAADAPVGDVV